MKSEEFIEGLYDAAEADSKVIYDKQKETQDELLTKVAMILLTYTILDGVMSLSRGEKQKEYSKLVLLVKESIKSTIEVETKCITDILTKVCNDTFKFYSYNANLKDIYDVVEKSFKGKHFSKRVWKNEEEVAKRLNKLLHDFVEGKVNVNQIKNEIQSVFDVSEYNAKRLVETEVARVEDMAFKRFCKEVGINKVIWNATLDFKTCGTCKSRHGEIYDLNDAPEMPAHPKCRCFFDVVE